MRSGARPTGAASPRNRSQEIGTTDKTGTRVTFLPDTQIFASIEFEFDVLSQRLRELSFLNAGLRIHISDERSGKRHEFCYEGGIVSFVEHLNRNRAPLHRPPILVSGERMMMQGGREVPVGIEIAIQYNESYNESVYSFANNINTVEGGSHLIGFRTALTRTLNRYIASQSKNGKGEIGRGAVGRRHARGAHRGDLGEAAAARVRGADQGEARHLGRARAGREHSLRAARRLSRGESRTSRAR